MSKREASQIIQEESPSRAEKFFKAKRRRQELREKKEASMLADEAALLAELDSCLQTGLIEMPIPSSTEATTGNGHGNSPENAGDSLGGFSGQLLASTFSNSEKLLKSIPRKETNGINIHSVPEVPVPIAIPELKPTETKAEAVVEHIETKINAAPETAPEPTSSAEPVAVQAPVTVPAPQLQASS
mmetsp:Transcript_753/g.1086  ORF Transcript_753/g.1086 Transcript_753/m.1086 type:complete len:186 (+) Transcript_753:91-648(+)|eukprot:CAMPEP_0185266528 /NCGR_PEP_ID=MMETSP1359-20130426/31396_1 /TAXON_ID=552665 /ORGANISM="Bigelowiella longifila, Strain CCMP242" /LENGTH=185 /DNA_ID=CAMNT_0027856383 /DNA_START=82 /DNA_END=639 /DNA_ORIENTATION=+